MRKRFFIAAIAAAYGAFCGSIPAAHALNTDLVIGLCTTCVKTVDFENAAWSLISSQTVVKWPGNYNQMTYTVIMSNTVASTAYVKISGYWGTSARRLVFIAQTFTPVDANGNSLAGQSETYLENYYTQVDWTVYGILRSDPLVATLQGAYAQTFINTPDTAISISIAIERGLEDPSPESLVKVIFNDHTIAFYRRTNDTNPKDTANWYVWATVAYFDKTICRMIPGGSTKLICGAPIDHKGDIIVNYNTSGKTYGGANPVPLYNITPTPLPGTGTLYCTYSAYATDPYGTTSGSTNYGPC